MSDLVLAFDTATAATVVGAARGDGTTVVRRHDPGPGERPGHATQLLALVDEALGELGATLQDVTRIGVGVLIITGLRIGVATGRAGAGHRRAGRPSAPTRWRGHRRPRPRRSVLAVPTPGGRGCTWRRDDGACSLQLIRWRPANRARWPRVTPRRPGRRDGAVRYRRRCRRPRCTCH